MSIYFVRSGDTGPIKIGFSNDIVSRLASMQTSNPTKLHIVRIIDGNPAHEKWLHVRYSSRRIRGEWFEFCPSMLDVSPEEFGVAAIASALPPATYSEDSPPTTVGSLYAAIVGHLRETGESATAFGRRVLNDGAFMTKLRNGRIPKIDTLDKIMKAIGV